MSDARDDQLLVLSEALRALGDAGIMEHYTGEIAVDAIVGSAVATRAEDFGRNFQPRNRMLTDRLRRATANQQAGLVDPVDLVQLGELFFVRDGHHRIAAASEAGIDVIAAGVTRYCTVAYAMCCLRADDLTVKAAERRFLEHIPLADDITRELWLDRPADWARLADAAHAWGFRNDHQEAHQLAAAWWDQEVLPIVRVLRQHGHGAALRDIQLYATALAARDGLGAVEWPKDFTVQTGACCEHHDGSVPHRAAEAS